MEEPKMVKTKIPRKRVITATIMGFLALFAVINEVFFVLFVIALTIGGLYEFFYLIQKKGIPIYSYTGIFIGALIPVSVYTRFELTKNWELLFVVLMFLMILMMQFARGDNKNAIVGISTTLFGVLYVAWFFSFLIKIRIMMPEAPGVGVKLLGFIILVTKSGDIGAYLIGKKFGKHHLIPRISPNKSVEGCLGSLAFSVVFAVIARSFIPAQLNYSWIHIALMGAFFGAVGQLGDLSESLIKRDCNVKDSGKLLPGMGGALDVIDSLLFAAPAFYLYMSSALNTI